MKTTTLTPEQIQALIVKRNKAFNKATAAQKRVMIAKDALERLDNEQIQPESGTWLSVDGGADPESQLQETILAGHTCECCAVGGLVASCIGFVNKVKTGDAQGWMDNRFNGQSIRNVVELGQLSQFFSHDQLKLIEMAFEGGDGAVRKLSSAKLQQKALEFYDKHSDDRWDDAPRFRAILLNIIKNKGTFRP